MYIYIYIHYRFVGLMPGRGTRPDSGCLDLGPSSFGFYVELSQRCKIRDREKADDVSFTQTSGTSICRTSPSETS